MLDKRVIKLRSKRDVTLTSEKPIIEEQREIAKLKKVIKHLEMEKDILKGFRSLDVGYHERLALVKGLKGTAKLFYTVFGVHRSGLIIRRIHQRELTQKKYGN